MQHRSRPARLRRGRGSARPRRADSSSWARNRYRLARPRRTEYCCRTSAPRSNSSRAPTKAASTSGVNPFVAISARARVIRRAISWSTRSADAGAAASTASRSVVRLAVSRYQPWASSRIEQRLREPVELLEVALGDPVRPGDPEVRDVRAELGQGGLAPPAGQVGAEAARQVGVVGRVGRRTRDATSGRCVEPVGRELADRLEHRDARLAAGRVDQADEALLDESGQPVEDVEIAVVGARRRRPRLRSRRSPRSRTRPAARTGAARRARGARSSSPSSPAASAGARAGRAARCAGGRAGRRAGRAAPRARTGAGGPRRARSPAAGRRAGGRSRRPPRRCRRSARSRGGRRGPGRRTAGRPRRRGSRRRSRARGPPAAARAAGPGRAARPGRGAPRGWWPGPSGPGSRSGAGPRRLAASVTCSKLSSTSSIRRSRSRSMSSSCSGRSMISPRPMARAIATRTAFVSRALDRSTNDAPSRNRSARSSATRIASVVLPVPPGPIRVSSRTDPSARRARICASSSLRPISAGDARRAGRHPAWRAVISGGKSAGRSGWTSWKRCSGRPRSFRRCSPRSRSAAPAGSSSRASEAADADSRTWPPCPAAMIRAVRLTVGPK